MTTAFVDQPIQQSQVYPLSKPRSLVVFLSEMRRVSVAMSYKSVFPTTRFQTSLKPSIGRLTQQAGRNQMV